MLKAAIRPQLADGASRTHKLMRQTGCTLIRISINQIEGERHSGWSWSPTLAAAAGLSARNGFH